MQVLVIIADVILILSSIALIAVVLLQPGKSAGLSGAIAGGAETFFGKNKAKSYEGKLAVATKATAAVVFVLSLALVIMDKFA
jgi:preprotein translocase subunit SecG